MNTRRDLLVRLFQLLEERQIPYCVLRNYRQLFEDSSSDVDLLTLPGRAAEVIDCCRRAGAATGHALIQRTRFVNHSLVFWNGSDGLVRIDLDTEKRWQRFHLLTAAQVLAHRQKRETFYVPSAPHEAVVIITQALWQGKLSERYAQRLRELRTELGDTEPLLAVLAEAFGGRESLLKDLENPQWLPRLASAVRRSVPGRPVKAWHSLRYFWKDALRLVARRRSPPGLFLRWVGGDAALAGELATRLAILFPLKKGLFRTARVAAEDRRRALFKGGLVIESLPTAAKPATLLRDDWPEPDRSFAVVCEPAGDWHFVHVGSGFMASGKDVAALAQFIWQILARLHAEKPVACRGAFAVLLGLDGAGKTTLARNLASQAANEPSLAGVRYFHWLPPLGDAVEFPLPEPGNLPRQPKRAGGFVEAALSIARLTKNLLRAQLVWWLRLRSLRDRGYLVLVDRYFYNYYLDPVSVKYYGPRRVLDALGRLFPKPEIVITLSAPPEVLLRRKQELTGTEIREQAATLQQLTFPTPRLIAADASEPAAVVAQKVLAGIRKAMS